MASAAMVARLSSSELLSLRSEVFADDIEIPAAAASCWSREDALKYFETGGFCEPSTSNKFDSLASLLNEAIVSQATRQLLAAADIADWLKRLRVSRHELFRRLHALGVSSRSEQQAIVNEVAKAWRADLLPLPTADSANAAVELSGLPAPIDLLREALASVATHSPASSLHSMAAADLLQLFDDLEAKEGWSFERVRLLREGCGLDDRVERPRLGEPIAFWTNQVCERGTEVALFDYADFAERCLGMTSWILLPFPPIFEGCAAKFKRRFGERVVELRSFASAVAFMSTRRISQLYVIKEGTRFVPDVEKEVPPPMRALVHCVFHADHPHGDVYAKISPCVRGVAGVPVVPHIVRRGERDGPDLRRELGIPPGATVIGRHGGFDTFDVDFAARAVIDVARRRCDRSFYFLFMNTLPVGEPMPNILHLERSSDTEYIGRFIRTCDAMLHARHGGETFGLAIAEFSSHGRPVFTSRVHDDDGTGSFHLDTLGSGEGAEKRRALFYSSYDDLVALLMGFDRDAYPPNEGLWNAYRDYEPAKVMEVFERVFLL